MDNRNGARTTISQAAQAQAAAPRRSIDDTRTPVDNVDGLVSAPDDAGGISGGGEGSDARGTARDDEEKEGPPPPGEVLSMRAIDDSAGKLGKAFAAAGVEAVLLRPDGHIAWLSHRRDTVGDSDEREGRGYSVLAEELGRALNAVYGWSDRTATK